jgi:hypothetical protein
MTPQAQAIADVIASETNNADNATVTGEGSATELSQANSEAPKVLDLDEYGRDVNERTVELSPKHAEAVDHEVMEGRHQTYDDALAYVITRGLQEIERVRKQARIAAQAKLSAVKIAQYKGILNGNPALVANAEFVATMMKDLGLK